MTTPTPLSAQCLAVAEEAALAVGPALLQAFRSPIDVSLKRNFHDFVTVHDQAAEAVIRRVITSHFPGSAIVGEEDGETGVGQPVWYVDPIDGTSNFARGLTFWCVSIAAAVDGQVIAGVVYDPVHDHMYRADVAGAWLNTRPISAVGNTAEAGATILSHYPTPSDLNGDRDDVLRRFGAIVDTYGAVRNLSSGALCLAQVAAGWADATFNFGTNAWDVAAGSFILRQAGGTYVAYQHGAEQPRTGDYLMPDYVGHVRDAYFPLITETLVAGGLVLAAR